MDHSFHGVRKSSHNSRVTRSAALTVAVALTIATTIPTASAAGFDYALTCNQASLTADFGQRDALPHTETPLSRWYEQRDVSFAMSLGPF